MSIRSDARPASSVLAAVRWMMVALVGFSLIAVAGRGAAKGLSTIDIMFYRGWLGVAIMLPVVLLTGGLSQLRTSQMPVIAVRSAFHFVAQYSWLYALTLIPLTQLFSIEFTAPLWTALFAPLIIGERLTASRIFAAVLGFIGILVVVRPAGFTLDEGSLFAFVAAICFAVHYVATKYLTRENGAISLIFYTNLLQSLAASVMVWPSLQLPDLGTFGWVLLLTLLGLAAHYGLTRAFALADAIVVAPMDFLRLPLIAVIGVLLYAEPLDPMVLAGAAVVVTANFINIWTEHRKVVA